MSDANGRTGIDGSDSALSAREQREAVRNRYGEIARGSESGCHARDSGIPLSGVSSGCCQEGGPATGTTRFGYTAEEIEAVAEGSNLGLGCGNPGALADLDRGETVLDLGSGAGFDCFLAARAVGPEGRVIGVDMTPAMVERARENAAKNGVGTVEFRLGEIEHLPVANERVDVVISNCVVNLSPAKPQVFAEAFRVLRPGGRLAIADVVLREPVPSEFRDDPESVAGCVGGAATMAEVEELLDEAGFEDVAIEPKGGSREFICEWSDERDLSAYVVSATIEGRKPESNPP